MSKFIMGIGKSINCCFNKKYMCKCCNKEDEMISIDKEWQNILQENKNDPDFEDIENSSNESEKEIPLKI